MQNIFQKPLTQKILLIVLLSGIATVIYVNAATNIGTNISTDGTLSVTGTTTLSSALNINDINVALSNSGDIGLNITGAAGLGVQSTRPIKIASSTMSASEYPLEIVMATNGYGLVFSDNLVGAYGIHIPGTISGDNTTAFHIGNKIFDNAIGIFMGGIEDTGMGLQQYLGGYTGHAGMGISQTFSNISGDGNEGVGLDIVMSNRNTLNKGINISGSVGTGIETTRPIKIASSTMGVSEYPLEIVVPANGYGLTLSGNLSSSYGVYFPGIIYESQGGVFFENISGGAGVGMNYIAGNGVGVRQFLGDNTSDAGIGLQVVFNNNSTSGNEGVGADIIMGTRNPLNIGINISGEVGLGITTARPVGIGTIAPAELLEIASNNEVSQTDVAIKIHSPGVSEYKIGIDNATSNLKIVNTDASVSGDFSNTNTNTDDAGITITPFGYIGIGTTTPSSLLHIANSAATSTITIGDETPGGSGACLKLRDSDDSGWTYCSVLDGALACSTTSCE